MIRKLLLPALLVGLLGGCVTGYGYRDGYYYGQPSVEYRYYDYGYPYYSGYGYYHPYSRYPYYGYPYYNRRPHYYYNPYYYHRQKPPRDHDDDNDRPPPWRDYDRRTRVEDALKSRVRTQNTPPRDQPAATPMPRRESRNDGDGSRMQQALRRAQDTRRRSGETQEP